MGDARPEDRAEAGYGRVGGRNGFRRSIDDPRGVRGKRDRARERGPSPADERNSGTFGAGTRRLARDAEASQAHEGWPKPTTFS